VPVTPGEHKLGLQLAGEAAPPAGLVGGLAYMRDAAGVVAKDGPGGLSIRRRYLRLPGAMLARARGAGFSFDDKLVARLEEWRGEARLGETILVELRLSSKQARRWMCLRDPLPAGCEAVADQPEGWPYWWEHHELRDEEAVFFFSDLRPGERVLRHLIRPASGGRYRVLPPQAWAMYDPEVRAHGAPAVVEVGDAP
jgi:uncharacterized protein YfaS (alpha-2-macroglobulin family)